MGQSGCVRAYARVCYVALALWMPAFEAHASVVSSFGASDQSLRVGEETSLTLSLDLTADPRYSMALFTGGTVTIFSGEGEKETFKIKAGSTSQDFTTSFTYDAAGDFKPRYVVKADYEESYWKRALVGKHYSGLEGWSTWLLCQSLLGATKYTDEFSRRIAGSLELNVDRPDEERPPQPIPGPIAGAGLPALLALGGFVWTRPRKAAARS